MITGVERSETLGYSASTLGRILGQPSIPTRVTTTAWHTTERPSGWSCSKGSRAPGAFSFEIQVVGDKLECRFSTPDISVRHSCGMNHLAGSSFMAARKAMEDSNLTQH
jgi:hypothetical protein